MTRPRDSARIAEHHGRYFVRIELGNGKIITADRDEQGRIVYSRVEKVPRYLKQSIVPRLFKEIDRRLFGMHR